MLTYIKCVIFIHAQFKKEVIDLLLEVTVHVSQNLYDDNQRYDQVYQAIEKVIITHNKKKPDHIPFFCLSTFYANDILNIGVSGGSDHLEKSKKDFLDLIIELGLNGSVKTGVGGKQPFWSQRD